jgi:hypothetical protein
MQCPGQPQDLPAQYHIRACGLAATFSDEYPADFTAGFRAGFAGNLPAGRSGAEDWDYLGRVLDMFALSDLVTRPAGHAVADQAAGQRCRAYRVGRVPRPCWP